MGFGLSLPDTSQTRSIWLNLAQSRSPEHLADPPWQMPKIGSKRALFGQWAASRFRRFRAISRSSSLALVRRGCGTLNQPTLSTGHTLSILYSGQFVNRSIA